ncbi:MAG: Ppx/GppA family phosphatase [Planctomycetes bacterium]|nr:Ppx/GppA family phosphatase [Planctomycetota bacterium]MBI3834354.1 Ppx/GppA family phosphatase [Planctomycetota bacterium]
MTDGNQAHKLRLAAIDVGSNSIRLVVAEVDADARYSILDEEREMTRLVCGLEETNELSTEAMERSADAICRMKRIADGFEADEIWAVATSAVREASNREAFCDLVRRRAGVNIEIISTETEARLAARSAIHRFDLSARRAAVMDIGGGSVELILCTGGLLEEIHSLPLGAVRMSDRFQRPVPWSNKETKRLRKSIDEVLSERLGELLFDPEVMIGSGGTFTSLAQMIRCQRERERQPGSVHGYVVTQTEIEDFVARLSRMTLSELRDVPGLNPQRADIIVAGAMVIDRVARRLGVRQIIVSEQGLRDGMLLWMVQRHMGAFAPAPSSPEERMTVVRAFARKCRSHEAHCEHVADLALQIFDDLRDGHQLTAESREILWAGAVLHDVGYLIGHEKHHKHAYHLIVHSAMPGFSTRELDLIANVARYHRRAKPHKSHPIFARLVPEDREMVRMLSGILRIADALDRTHLNHVQSARAERRAGITQIVLRSDANVAVEVEYALRKGDLFEEAFDTHLRLLTAPATNGTPMRTFRGEVAIPSVGA